MSREKTDVISKLQTLLDTELNKKNTHNILLSVQSKSGDLNFSGAAGDGDAEQDQPLTPKTPYFIASITKMYTATLIMKLVDLRLLKLDDLISQYLPEHLLNGIHTFKGVDYSSQLKVYQLLHQTSGLADYFEGKPKTNESLMDKLKNGQDVSFDVIQVTDKVREMTPKFDPDAKNGTRSHYSDTNYQLLGAIIESLTGKSVAENYHSMIFEPLGLTQTYLYNHQTPPEGEHPVLFYNKEQIMNIPKTMTSFGPDGGIVSTLSESMIFLRVFFDGELFPVKHFDRMTAQWNTVFFPIVKYGYGMMRFKLSPLMTMFQYSPEFLGHSGANGSFAFYAPQEEIYITGTFNQIDAPSRPFIFIAKLLKMLRTRD